MILRLIKKMALCSTDRLYLSYVGVVTETKWTYWSYHTKLTQVVFADHKRSSLLARLVQINDWSWIQSSMNMKWEIFWKSMYIKSCRHENNLQNKKFTLLELKMITLCKIWGFHCSEDSSWVLAGCDTM